MYYNIKIITKDSELGLASSDRSIVEKEMDIYFAFIFGASSEFKAKLKEIKPDNNKLRSINEIADTAKADSIKFEADKEETLPKIEQNQPEINIAQEDTIVNEHAKDKEIRLAKKAAQISEALENIFEQNKNDAKDFKSVSEDKLPNILPEETKNDNIINEDVRKELTADKELMQATGSYTSAEKYIAEDNEEKELEQEAQKLYSELQQQVKAEIQQEESSTQPKQEEPGFAKQESTIDSESFMFQDIIDTYKEKGLTPTSASYKAPQYYNEDDKTDNDEILQENNEIKDLNVQNSEQSETKDVNPINKTLQAKVPNISLSAFLSGFITDDIKDEFLITAEYIKNILHEDSFTMKQINAKLFQTTGKIADTSIVDELIKKDYIKTMESEDYIRYSISIHGEEYIASKLQN